ncbi:hypothetical protein EVAR_6800_1 [Eumeta japonica]|uniref:Uncharacterized protein n=1 Tax=Eumeta variegata TaxID=151549 RepID=A0A4C1U6B8_EUMVA|nr:hypothetical protein EVAR_6800_1 [Eumeta japonica]
MLIANPGRILNYDLVLDLDSASHFALDFDSTTCYDSELDEVGRMEYGLAARRRSYGNLSNKLRNKRPRPAGNY